MDSSSYDLMRTAIRGENLDGWLFYNFHHRDPLADQILERKPSLVNSRPWVYAAARDGESLKLVHAIERDALDGLPGKTEVYSSAEQFNLCLKSLSGRRWGAHFSDTLPIISYLDKGMFSRFETAGLILVSAASLIQRFKGLLDKLGFASHLRANAALHQLIDKAWSAIERAYHAGDTLFEGDIRRLLLEGLAEKGLISDHPPIVAVGANSGNPHYDFSGDGAPFRAGDCVQLDIWAKEKAQTSIYADISWVGVYGPQAAAPVKAAFQSLRDTRDAAVAFIEASLAKGASLTGAEVDSFVRHRLSALGYSEALRHRTGHGIDTECHGSGVNLDAVEFPDHRFLLEGSCFSIEPGLYFDDFGLRTEIDVVIKDGRPLVSGPPPQAELLNCGQKR